MNILTVLTILSYCAVCCFFSGEYRIQTCFSCALIIYKSDQYPKTPPFTSPFCKTYLLQLTSFVFACFIVALVRSGGHHWRCLHSSHSSSTMHYYIGQ